MKAYSITYQRGLVREAEVEAVLTPRTRACFKVVAANGKDYFGTREDLFDTLIFAGDTGYVFSDTREKAFAALLRGLKERRSKLMREVESVVEDIAVVMDARDGIK